MASTIGLDPTRIDDSPAFGVGQFGDLEDRTFVYVKAGAAISQSGAVLSIDGDTSAAELTTTNDAIGRRVGIAPAAATSGQYFWALVRGQTQFLVAGSCAANAVLRATAVGGVVDDVAGAGPAIEGLISNETAGAMQELVKGRAVYPTLQVAGGAGTGTLVVAYPGGTGLTSLATITIGATDYAIPSGGGGGAVDAAAIIAAVTGTPADGNHLRWGTGDALTWEAPPSGGGGGGGTSPNPRVEAVAFVAVTATTSQNQQPGLNAGTPISVVYGEGAAEILSGIAAETTFTVLLAGVYAIEWVCSMVNAGQRATPSLELQLESDDSILGHAGGETPYIRNSNTTAITRYFDGTAIITAANSVVKVIISNLDDQGSFAVTAGHTLRFIRYA